MAIINLREYYPFYSQDVLMEVTDDTVAQLNQWKRDENAHHRKKHWHHAHYSLDSSEGIERFVLLAIASPEEVVERKQLIEQIYAAIRSLPHKQRRHIHFHYMLGLSKAQIAKMEGISSAAVGQSIAQGRKKMNLFLKNLRKDV